MTTDTAPQPHADTILSIRDLSIDFQTLAGPVHALRRVSVDLPKGAIVGIVGESGSGKSTLALAVMRLMAANALVTGGTILYGGRDILGLGEEELRALRGCRISMIFQDPMTSLNPVRSIGQQMADIQFRDRVASRTEKLARAAAALERVGLPDPESQLSRYPHQLSGGMRQRVSIAMSLLLNPEILIADEVTTALDVTLEAQILHLIRKLQRESGASVLFISHNLGAIAEICDHVVVLYAGEVVEAGPVEGIFHAARHPYTRALIACDPARIEKASRDLPVIPGDVPNLRVVPEACIFAPRCPEVIEKCRRERPAVVAVGPGHRASCHLVSPGGGAA